jgi:hypothetical protein
MEMDLFQVENFDMVTISLMEYCPYTILPAWWNTVHIPYYQPDWILSIYHTTSLIEYCPYTILSAWLNTVHIPYYQPDWILSIYHTKSLIECYPYTILRSWSIYHTNSLI